MREQALGGGIYFVFSSAVITNCTVVENSSNYGGGMYYINSNSAVITNTILWGNTASIQGNQIQFNDAGSSVTITYSDLQEGENALSGDATAIANSTF